MGLSSCYCGWGGWVDADSAQLKIYALGAIRSASKNGIPPPGQIELRIVQPHHGEVRSHSMTYSELFDWYQNTLRPAIGAVCQSGSMPMNLVSGLRGFSSFT